MKNFIIPFTLLALSPFAQAHPQQPVVAVESGKELTIANLNYNKNGFYALKSIRFLTRKEK